MSEKPHKSGFVSIIGKPNAGKSTLMNAIVGKKLAITTPKAQTTRHRILGIATGDDYQIVFSDTPGVILPQYRLHRVMMKSVRSSMEDADLIILLVDVNEKFPEELVLDLAKKSHVPVLLVLNKVDKSNEEKVRARHAEITSKIKVAAAIGVSALVGINMLALKDMIIDMLPEGPPYFDKDQLSDRPERFFISELIREKIFTRMQQEIPYSCEVGIVHFEEADADATEEVEDPVERGGAFKKKPDSGEVNEAGSDEEKSEKNTPQKGPKTKNITRIHAEIYVERESQKGMVVGKGGRMIKDIGQAARIDIEAFLGTKVYLELRVRVADNWKDNTGRLRNFGYS